MDTVTDMTVRLLIHLHSPLNSNIKEPTAHRYIIIPPSLPCSFLVLALSPTPRGPWKMKPNFDYSTRRVTGTVPTL